MFPFLKQKQNCQRWVCVSVSCLFGSCVTHLFPVCEAKRPAYHNHLTLWLNAFLFTLDLFAVFAYQICLQQKFNVNNKFKKHVFFPPLLIIFIFFVSLRPFGAHLALNKLKKSTTKNSDRSMFLPSWPVTSWRWLHPEYFQALILSTHCAFPKKPFLPPGTNECVQAKKK